VPARGLAGDRMRAAAKQMPNGQRNAWRVTAGIGGTREAAAPWDVLANPLQATPGRPQLHLTAVWRYAYLW